MSITEYEIRPREHAKKIHSPRRRNSVSRSTQDLFVFRHFYTSHFRQVRRCVYAPSHHCFYTQRISRLKLWSVPHEIKHGAIIIFWQS